jgi:hypothetical protein
MMLSFFLEICLQTGGKNSIKYLNQAICLMRPNMHKFIVTLFFGLLFAVPTLGYGSDHSKNLFVIVTTDDPVTQLMAMVLSTQTMKK